jgi:hypothetical protein
MGEIIVPNAVERKPGYLYYIDGEGNLMEVKMARHGKSKIQKVGRPEKVVETNSTVQ